MPDLPSTVSRYLKEFLLAGREVYARTVSLGVADNQSTIVNTQINPSNFILRFTSLLSYRLN